MANKLVVAPAPHVQTTQSTNVIMRDVIIALLPALAVSTVVFGLNVLLVTALSVACCVLFEYLIQRFLLKTTPTISDGSAVLTGLLLSFNLPSNLPVWIVVIGALVAIGIGKMSFGGLGNNVGFYAFTAANISSGTNAIWKSTYWDMTNWTLHHGGVLHCTGGIYSDSYVSAKGNNSSSDIRLKNILCHIRPSMEAFAKAPLFRFAWKSDPGMVEIGSSAQYWRNVLPDTVKERDGWLEMGYGNIALAGVITIARDFETLEQRVDRLEKENGKLKKRIKELERRAA